MGLDRTKFIKNSGCPVSDKDCKKLCSLKIDDSMFQTVVEVFSSMDTDKSGTINVSELDKGLACCGFNPTKAEIDAKMKKFDCDSDGLLDLVEFAKFCQDAMSDCEGKDPKETLCNALKKFDKKKAGHLTADQVVDILAKLGNEKIPLADAKQIVKDADKNGDGKLQIEEFAEFLLQDSPQQKKGGKK